MKMKGTWKWTWNDNENVDVDKKMFPLILGEFPWQKIREKFARYVRE